MAGRSGVARGVLLAGLVVVLAGCGSSQSTLAPHSGPAHDIDRLWWVMFAGWCTTVGAGALEQGAPALPAD